MMGIVIQKMISQQLLLSEQSFWESVQTQDKSRQIFDFKRAWKPVGCITASIYCG